MDKILYVDVFNFFYSSLAVDQSMNMNGDPIGAFVGTINRVQKLVTQFRPQRVVLVFDGSEAGLRRRHLFSEYKGRRNRKARTARVNFGDGEFLEINNEEDQLKQTYAFLSQLPVSIVIIPYYEADDIIAHLVLNNPDCNNIICSSDKDYLQLVTENTSVWSWSKKMLFTTTEVVEHYNVLPLNFPYFRSIVGDSSDNLPGVDGVGEKTVLALFPELKEKTYETFGEFWEVVRNKNEEEITQTKLRNGLIKIKGNREQIELMYTLMRLHALNLKLKYKELLNQQLQEQEVKRFTTFQLKQYCLQEQLESSIKNFDWWVKPFVSLKKLVPLEV